MIIAAKRGQAVHFGIEMLEKFGVEIIEEEYKTRLEAYKKFKNDYKLESIKNEYMICSDLNYAGTLDNIAYITVDGKRLKSLGDFKNTSKLHNDLVGLQLSGYNQGIIEEGINDIEIYWCVNLKDNGKYEITTYSKEEIQNYFEDFKFYLEVIKKNKYYLGGK